MKRLLLASAAVLAAAAPAMAAPPAIPPAYTPPPAWTLASPGQTPALVPGFVNWGPQASAQIIRDVANVSVTTTTKTKGVWLFDGDSTMAGHCAVNTPAYCTDNRPSSWPFQLALQMRAADIPTDVDGWFGCSNESSVSACATFDPRLSFGTGWTVLNQTNAIGGMVPNFPANTTPAPLTFNACAISACQAYNQVDLYLLNGTAASTFTIDRDGVAPSSSTITNSTGTACTVSAGTVTTSSGATGVCKITFTWAATITGKINLNATSSGTGKFYIIGEFERDSNNPKIEFVNAAVGGSNSVNWTATNLANYTLFYVAAAVSPTVTWNNLGINDWNPTATTLSTYQANMASLQTQAHTYGANVFLFGAQSNPASYASVATQKAYGGVTQALAGSGGDGWINFQYRWTNWANACALGFMGLDAASTCDGRHPSAVGYTDQANMVMGALGSLIGFKGQSPSPAPLRAITAGNSYIAAASDAVIVVNKTSSSATSITLDATPQTGETHIIIDGKGDAGANNITIAPASGNINGSTTYVINANRGAARIVYDGTEWDSF